MDNSTQPPAKNPQRFFDIVPQNKTVPNTSSRPIVVTNQPEQADPMMRPKSATTDNATNQTPAEPAQISVATAMESSSEPIMFDTPSVPEPPEPEESPAADVNPEVNLSTTKQEDDVLRDMPVELPTSPSSDVVVVHHGLSSQTVRNLIKIALIVVMLLVIADLVLDIGLLKLALPHTHYFGS